MKTMPKLSLAEAIRYFFPGLVGVLFLALVRPSVFEVIQKELSPIGFLLAVLVGSAVLYLLYRSFVYDSFVRRLQDLLRRGPSNYRLFLKKEYGLNHTQAVEMFTALRDKYLLDRYLPGILVRAASIHMVYITGMLSIPFAIWSYWLDEISVGVLLTVVAMVCIIGAFVDDRRYEEMELGFIKSISSNDRMTIREQLFGPMPSSDS